MDPSQQLAKLKYGGDWSLNPEGGYKTDQSLIIVKSNKGKISIKPVTDDTKKLTLLIDQLDTVQYQILMSLVNPFYTIGKSVFSNRDGVRMANIDAIFKLIGTKFNDLSSLPVSSKARFIYCVLGDFTGGVASYIQYRGQYTLGYEMHDTIDGNLNTKNIETEGVNIYQSEYGDMDDGGDQTGNLLVNTGALITKLLKYHPTSISLVIGWSDKITNATGLMIAELLAIVKLLRRDGSAIIRLQHPLDSRQQQLLLVVASLFDSFHLIKPVSSYNHFNESYGIFTKINKEREKVIALLTSLYGKPETELPISLVKNVDPNFTKYFQKAEKHVIDVTTTTLRQMKTKSRNWEPNNTRYNLVRLLKVWDIPSKKH